MELDKIYTFNEIASFGLTPNQIENVDFKVYEGTKKVYFFESVGGNNFRLYSIISKKSFFL
ncbi:MAG: hypothetical protein U5Q03_10070 [Bacteroidota bacterium]|nr:hypothetical protein [Bacteroidota bacterium]